jgi:hypothetical protein
MNKIYLFNVPLLVLSAQFSFGQNIMTEQAAKKAAFLAKAPARVQEYYRVFDSLANPTWSGKVHEEWSLRELKKYASLVYDANEYDPVQSQNNYANNLKIAHSLNSNYITDEFDVYLEVRDKISKRHALVMRIPYWLKITVESIAEVPYVADDDPNDIYTKVQVRVKVTKVWKGKMLNVGDVITCYYIAFWNYFRSIEVGKSYIISPYPIIKEGTSERISYALGSPSNVQQSIFPIDNGYVIDEDNIFALSAKVEYEKFEKSLSSTINQIKSWGDSKILEEGR